jgi:phage terminase Nu1 subunit (DNA packaging protein)
VQPNRNKTKTDLAAVLELSIPTIERYVKQGMPCTKRGKTGNLYDEAECQAWIKANEKTGKAGRPVQYDSEELRLLKVRKESALVARLERENKVAEATLIDKADEERRDVGNVLRVKNRLSSLGSSLSVQLEGLNAAERQHLIETTIDDILREFSI